MGGLACQEVGGAFSQVGGQRGAAPASPIYTSRNPPLTLVEHDGLWILVHHLRHVTQDVLLGDDPEETTAGRDAMKRSEVTAYVMMN